MNTTTTSRPLRTDRVLDILALTVGYRRGFSWVNVAAHTGGSENPDVNYDRAASRAASAGWQYHGRTGGVR